MVAPVSARPRMSHQVLARKWRPKTFGETVGQAHVLRALVNALSQGRVHQAYLFTGTRGVGKTTLARILAKALNCESGVTPEPCGRCSNCREIDEGRFVDLIEVDAASRTKVEDTRELLENVQYAPARGRYKVYLIDEVHMLSAHSFNALLKTLEEPPEHVKFLLATTDPQKLPITVLSRCLQFNLRRVPEDAIRARLAQILEAEGIEFDEAALAHLARAADGSLRDALSLLDQAIAYGGGRVAGAEVAEMLGFIEADAIEGLLEALARADASALLAVAAELEARGADFGAALDELLGALQRIAVLQWVPESAASDAQARWAPWAERLGAEDVQLYYQIALLGKRDLELAPSPRGGFEMILLRMLAFRPEGVAAGGDVPAGGAGRAASRPPTGREARPAGGATTAARDVPAAEPAAPTRAPDTPAAVGEADWPRLCAAMGLNGLTAQLAANCALKARDGDHWILVLARRHAQLHKPSTAARLEKALAAHLGRPVRLTIRVEEAVDGATPAAAAERRAAAAQQAAEAALAADPLVRALCERFDAQIEAGSVRPPAEPDPISKPTGTSS
ncbi:MAG: hypothetical protein KatS3mg121_0848 [Gammaproteobacteria bacterium]|nr:MAG: hypothetical protein KatS3mg121_0848 [Gammaproteobacteria bacterium]